MDAEIIPPALVTACKGLDKSRLYPDVILTLEPPPNHRRAWGALLQNPPLLSRLTLALLEHGGALFATLARGSNRLEPVGAPYWGRLEEELEGELELARIPDRLPAPLASLIRGLVSAGATGGRLVLELLERLEGGERLDLWTATREGAPLSCLGIKYLCWALFLDRISRPIALPLASLEGLAFAAGGERLELEGGGAGAGGEERLAIYRGEGLALGYLAPTLAPTLPHLATLASSSSSSPTLAPVQTLAAIVAAGADKSPLRTLIAARFVAWFGGVVQDRDDQGGDVDILGGWAGLAGYLTGGGWAGGAGGEERLERLAPLVRDVVLSFCRLLIPGKPGDYSQVLFLRRYLIARGRSPSSLVLSPGDCWRSDLRSSRNRPGGGYLAPLLLPPLSVGRNNDKGPLSWAFFLILCELRKQAPDLFGGVGAYLPLGRLEKLLELAGGPATRGARKRLILSAIDLWTGGGEGAPPVMEVTGADRYHISQDYPAIRRFLEEGGRRSIEGRRRGQGARGRR